MSQSPNKITLEEYLHAQKIKKKLQQRHRSKSKKSRQDQLAEEQEQALHNIFGTIDSRLYQVKLDIQETLQVNYSKDKLLIYLSTALDRLLLQVKEQIRKMYKEVYTQYTMEFQKASNPQTEQFLKNKFEKADSEVKKLHLKELIKQKFKDQEKQKTILDAIFRSNQTAQKKAELCPQTINKQDQSRFIDALRVLTEGIPLESHVSERKPDTQRPATKKSSLSPPKLVKR